MNRKTTILCLFLLLLLHQSVSLGNQFSSGSCSPNIAEVGRDVTVNCGISTEEYVVMAQELGLTTAAIEAIIRLLDDKTLDLDQLRKRIKERAALASEFHRIAILSKSSLQMAAATALLDGNLDKPRELLTFEIAKRLDQSKPESDTKEARQAVEQLHRIDAIRLRLSGPPVDFCDRLRKVVDAAWTDFKAWPGTFRTVEVGEYEKPVEIDLTASGNSKIVARRSDKHFTYHAEFAISSDPETADKQWNTLRQEIGPCLGKDREIRNKSVRSSGAYWEVAEKAFDFFYKGSITVWLWQPSSHIREKYIPLEIHRD